jgi:hypothetical protein
VTLVDIEPALAAAGEDQPYRAILNLGAPAAVVGSGNPLDRLHA